MRILLIITCLAFVTACTRSNKETATTGEELEVSKSEIPEGVIIQPQTETDTLKGSLKAYAVGKIGGANFTVNYYSPATRGRMIWGGLVAYDNVWVTGAHKATSIEFDKDIKIGDTIVKAGKYAFFTIPGKDQWTIIINKNWNQHLADDYSEAEDVVRLQVTPEVNESHQERLRYVIAPESETNGKITMSWDKVEVAIPIQLVR
ncbi:MAG: DUF2911 domain-containing protein [Cyclobacteriaceae bacterium]|nr:DUF2911 domain-containing protein [Cyclobacteriaceae bacterium]